MGARLAEAARREPNLRDRVLFTLPGPSSVDNLGAVSRALASAVLEHGADAPVELAYPRGSARGMHRAVLLAGEREAKRPSFNHYSSLRSVLVAAARESVTGRLRRGLRPRLRFAGPDPALARRRGEEQAKRDIEANREAELDGDLRVGQQEQITRELVELTAGLLTRRR